MAGEGPVTILAVADRGVFLTRESSSPLRYDVDAGVLEPVDEADVVAARRGATRALVVGPSGDDGTLLSWEGDRGSINTVETLTVHDSLLDELVDPHTGESVGIRVPAVYESDELWFVQWVDDDRFTLISGKGAPVGDLLVCRITQGQCDVALDRAAWTSEPLLPGHGGVGAELALLRGLRAVREAGGERWRHACVRA